MIRTRDLDLLLVDRSYAARLNQASAQLICFVTLGLIQAALLRATSQDADVEEIDCKAAGAQIVNSRSRLASNNLY